jgi:hypothetical protein
MRGATPPLPNTSSWRDAQSSTGTTLPLPFTLPRKFIGMDKILQGLVNVQIDQPVMAKVRLGLHWSDCIMNPIRTILQMLYILCR